MSDTLCDKKDVFGVEMMMDMSVVPAESASEAVRGRVAKKLPISDEEKASRFVPSTRL